MRRNPAVRYPHTSINVLLHKVLDGALVGVSHGLLLNRATAVVEAFRLVHGALERVALPSVRKVRSAIDRKSKREKQGDLPKEIIGVGARAVALERPNEGVLILGGIPEAVEDGRIPLNLKRNLGYANRVGCRAGRGVGEALAGDGVIHVALVVGAVQALAVPASVFNTVSKSPMHTRTGFHLRWEVVGCEDAVAALGLGEVVNNCATAAP